MFTPGTEILCEVDETVEIINKFFADIGKNVVATNDGFTTHDQLDPTPDGIMEKFL